MSIQWISSTREAAWQSRECSGAMNPVLQITEERFQTIEGFGGCFNELGWIAMQALSDEARGEVFDALFDPAEGCRFNLCRLPIGASDYGAQWYSHNEHEGDFNMSRFSIERDEEILIPYIRQALARRSDLQLFASPWSPPTWFKYPRAYNHGTMIWDAQFLDAYALYFARFVEAYAAEGITIHQVHPQNEPVADQKFPSCVWKGEELRDFIRDHLVPCFRKRGLDTEIWLGTLNTDDYDNYVHKILSDAEAYAAIAGVGFQWAGKGAIQRTAESWPEKRLMQTENECGDGKNTWEYAHYVFNLLRHYLANGANAYVYWNMVLAPGGASTWGWHQNAMITVDGGARSVTYNPEFYVMKHFSRFVAPGARRCGLRGSWSGNALGFENPDGSRVLLVANPFEEERPLALPEAGAMLPPASFNTFVLGA